MTKVNPRCKMPFATTVGWTVDGRWMDVQSFPVSLARQSFPVPLAQLQDAACTLGHLQAAA